MLLTKTQTKKGVIMQAGRWKDLNILPGFLVGLRLSGDWTCVLLCNGAPPGRGFPALLLLGQQFLQLSSPSIHTYATSKGSSKSLGFLKVRACLRFIATKHYFTFFMLFHPPDEKFTYVFILPCALCSCPKLFWQPVTTSTCLWGQRITISS